MFLNVEFEFENANENNFIVNKLSYLVCIFDTPRRTTHHTPATYLQLLNFNDTSIELHLTVAIGHVFDVIYNENELIMIHYLICSFYLFSNIFFHVYPMVFLFFDTSSPLSIDSTECFVSCLLCGNRN